MTSRDITLAAAGAAGKTYIEDVFSTYLYTGNGATQTINNGIDLAGKGGLVWVKNRGASASHCLFDTNRGVNKYISSDYAGGEGTFLNSLTAFNANGFSLGSATLISVNSSSNTYVSWAFRKQPKFFDVVTYTGTGANRTISHNLGSVPGMIIVKDKDFNNFAVYSRGQTSASYYTKLNLTDAQASDSTVWNGTAPTSSVFSVGTSALTNYNGSTYVAYLFAHDTSTDGLIQCGSFTTDASGNATVNLGWEPQYVMTKNTTSAESWYVQDNMRSMSETSYAHLYPNTSAAEASGSLPFYTATATGFNVKNNTASKTFIYMAIRRGPMRTPTDGTKVFNSVARTGTGVDATVSPGFVTDAVIEGNRTSTTAGTKFGAWDRLRNTSYLITNTTAAEVAAATTIIQANPWDVMDGYKVGTTSTLTNSSGGTFINWMFQRAPGFFDEVCYTGTGVAGTINHNLKVAPELMIVKSRSTASTTGWLVGNTSVGYTKKLYLNLTNQDASDNTAWNATAPTASVFSVGTNVDCNSNGTTYVAYLFASCPGVSKVGSYTGNGSSQTINCGFSAGARFVLIKRTDSTGDWYVWDTARGIVSANDPHLSLNTTADEVTTDDTIDPDNSGFIVNQVTATNVNVSSATYIYLAIA